MEAFGVKEMAQIKLAVKAKLTELGAYVDEELPDYILVMISNRRSKAQMKSDLSLFLGSHTDSFTEWLYVVLQRLESFASNATNKVKEIPKLAEKSKSADETTPGNYSTSKCSESQKGNKTLSRKGSDPAAHSSTSIRDIRSKTESKSMKSSSMEEPYEPSPVISSSSRCVSNIPVDEKMEEDYLNIRHEGDKDLHTEDHHSRRQGQFSGKNRKEISFDKKRRLGNRTEERSVKKICRDSRHSRDWGRLDRDDTRSRPGERSRREDKLRQEFQSEHQSAETRPKIGSVVKPIATSFAQSIQPESHSSKKEDLPDYVEVEKDNDRNGGVPSVVRVTPRPRLPAKLQATKSLVLKAVAEAQKSVAANPPKVVEVPEKKPPVALFTKRYREKTDNSSRLAVLVTSDSPAMEIDGSGTIASEKMECNKAQEEDETGNNVQNSPENSMETRFIVTLDGFHLNVDDQLNDDIEEDDSMVEDRSINTQPSNIKSRLFRRRSTGSDAGTQQTLERCKYWPSCRQGDRCSYHHPSLPCKTFPYCTFGDSCLFVHPQCKFDASCTRKKCPYAHTTASRVARTAAAPPPPVTPPSFVAKSHSSANGKSLCKFFPLCNNVSCQFYHPLACKFGSNCTRSGCSFYHPAKVTPSSDKMKWVATK